MASVEIIVLIPESTRKRKGGTAVAQSDAMTQALPAGPREKLEGLRDEVAAKSARGTVDSAGFLPAYHRFDGNMYRYIPDETWERRASTVEVVNASGLSGIVAARDR